MKTSEILKLARPLIKDYEFLCHALHTIQYRAGAVTSEDTGRVREIISDRLGKSYTLNSWLEDNHGISRENMSEAKYYRKMLQTRLAWCDSMIAEFSAKGD